MAILDGIACVQGGFALPFSNCYQTLYGVAWWSYAGFVKETKCNVPNIVLRTRLEIRF
jgi:hypothetical protein